MKIRINSENQNKRIRIDRKKTDRAAIISLKSLKKDNCELNIVFISSQKIRVLNRKYFGKDKATDVIAFPAVDKKRSQGRRAWRMAHGGNSAFIVIARRSEAATKQSLSAGAGVKDNEFLGDIAISTDRARRNAKIYGTSLLEETVLYVAHGILHLSGYEDTSVKKRNVMKKKENEIFQNIKKFL
ncbi:MAG: rRNA maturation RNase YbeY [Candidatus Omnitrophota bacterium]